MGGQLAVGEFNDGNRTCPEAVNSDDAGNSCLRARPLSSGISTVDSVLIHTPEPEPGPSPEPLLDFACQRC